MKPSPINCLHRSPDNSLSGSSRSSGTTRSRRGCTHHRLLLNCLPGSPRTPCAGQADARRKKVAGAGPRAGCGASAPLLLPKISHINIRHPERRRANGSLYPITPTEPQSKDLAANSQQHPQRKPAAPRIATPTASANGTAALFPTFLSRQPRSFDSGSANRFNKSELSRASAQDDGTFCCFARTRFATDLHKSSHIKLRHPERRRAKDFLYLKNFSEPQSKDLAAIFQKHPQRNPASPRLATPTASANGTVSLFPTFLSKQPGSFDSGSANRVGKSQLSRASAQDDGFSRDSRRRKPRALTS